MSSSFYTRLCAVVVTLGCLTGLGLGAQSALAGSARGLKSVRYGRVVLRVPSGWPIFHLGRGSSTCVRFNRHAVYLGTPGREERCPAHAVGRTDAILLAPGTTGGRARAATASTLRLEGRAASFRLTAAHIEVTMTWSRSPSRVFSALGLRSPPRSKQGSSSRAHAAAPLPGSVVSPSRRTSGVIYTGRGFDACTAPSHSQMSAWTSSPYRAVGVYIGGTNMGCAQPNLTSAWVSHEVSAGWHLIPTYVSLQAPSNTCGCSAMSTSTREAKAQGEAAAADAVTQATRLGIGAGSPLYDDMEGYSRGGSHTRAVLAFLSGWTTRLHSDGYLAGVYSSAASGISDLVAKYRTTYPEANDIWIADWNGEKTTSDPYVPGADWPHHQRLHQYAGNRSGTYRGVTLSIDEDYLNGATAYR